VSITDKIKKLFHREASPETQEQRAARAKAGREADQVREEVGMKTRVDSQIPPF
jgi:hypothetical protein